ncbi:MAG: leucine-rich repeat protein [Bacteroidales bacterium]|nr:leucine-rich repeat protein [Candidatus Sodaliphilus limicaballi]
MIKKTLLLIACAIVSWGAMQAEIVTINGVIYDAGLGQALVKGCEPGIKNLVIPAQITYNGKIFPVTSFFGDGVANNTELETATIDGSEFSVTSRSFKGCANLKKVTLLEGVHYMGAWCFEGCVSLEEITMTNSVKTLGYGAFSGCVSLKSLTLSNSITKIEEYAFNECKALTHINLPPNLETIGQMAFNGCSSLRKISLPTTLKKLDHNTFSKSGLRYIYIPEGITEMGFAFAGCKELRVVSLPSTLTRFQGFYSCSGITDVECRSTTPVKPTYDFERDVYQHAQLYVPKGCVTAYKRSGVWGNFIGITDDYSPFPLTDTTGDKVTDVSDANRTINMILGRSTDKHHRDDVNRDGTIDITDLNEVTNEILGK